MKEEEYKIPKDEINKIKSHIKRVFPRANRVDIKVKKLPNGLFKSFIRVIAPQKNELIALKKDGDLKKSLEKSHFAIIRQIHRLKTKWEKRTSKLNDFAVPA